MGSAEGARGTLLVDDDAELAQMVADYLWPEGFAVDVAQDGGRTCCATPCSTHRPAPR